jgi:hypothetical protein
MTDNLAGQLAHRLLQRLRRVQVPARTATTSIPTGHAVLPVARLPAAPSAESLARISPLTAVDTLTPRRTAALRVPGARCRVDPADGQRALISGRMNEVCDALDRLIAHQAIPPAPVGFAPTRV